MGYKFQKLEVYQIALDYLDGIYSFLDKLPDFERFNLKDQLRRSGTSIVLNISEGSTTKPRLVGSYEKAKKHIGYEPKTSFEQGLKNTIDWFKENWNNIEKSADFGPGMSSAVRGVSQRQEG